MPVRVIGLPASAAGPVVYELSTGETFILSAAAWQHGAGPSSSDTAVPSVLVRSPSGELLARILSPPVAAPLYFPMIKCRALLFPTPPPGPGGSYDVTVQKDIPALLPEIHGSWEFFVRAGDVSDMVASLSGADVFFSAGTRANQWIENTGNGFGIWKWGSAGDFEPVAAGWHTATYDATYDGAATFQTITLDGNTQTQAYVGAPPPNLNFGITDTVYGPFADRLREWNVWFRHIAFGTTPGGTDLLDFGATATDLSMFDTDTAWGTDGSLATFDTAGP